LNKKSNHFSNSLKHQITKENLERGSHRILGRRYGRSKNTVAKIIHEVVKNTATSFDIAEKLKPKWSGTLTIDGKFIKAFDWFVKTLKEKHNLSGNELHALHRKAWLCGIDYETGDLPHYGLADSENRIDLILFYKQLQKNGYILRNLVSDGSPEILCGARKVYGDNFIFQLCTRHFLEGLRGLMVEKEIEQNIPETETLIKDIQAIIQAKTLKIAKENLELLKTKKHFYKTIIQKIIIRQFKEKFNSLMPHLFYPERNIPHTNNDIENLFKQLNLNIKSIGRFNKFWNAHHYLNAWALKRRFTKFTDCRGWRKYRNGKAPLELAGCDIDGLDYLNFFK
jgi:hypothetical protein